MCYFVCFLRILSQMRMSFMEPFFVEMRPGEARPHSDFIISAERASTHRARRSHKFPPLERTPKAFRSFLRFPLPPLNTITRSNLYAFSPALPSLSISLSHLRCMNEFQFIQLHEPYPELLARSLGFLVLK